MAPRNVANPTGFDIKKFIAASRMPKNDPWARNEAWRYTGPFTRANRFKNLFPGFGIALGAFTVYCAYEYVFLKDDHHGHQENGHEQKH